MLISNLIYIHYPIDRSTIDTIAATIPKTPIRLNLSLKIKTPINTVVNRLRTDHITPTMDS